MRGGMTMVSDLFNNQLKNQVNNICSEISSALANHQLTPFAGSFQSQSQNGNSSQAQSAGGGAGTNSLFAPDTNAQWWPAELGAPNATGSQNNLRYAYFSSLRRLAVKTGSDIWVYDTLNHTIGGFSQQQSGGSSISFSSQYGTVNLASLPVVSRNGIAQPSQPAQPTATAVASYSPSSPAPSSPAPNSPAPSSQVPQPTFNSNAGQDSTKTQSAHTAVGENVLDTIERLGGLVAKGLITDEEFAEKKAELLSRL